MTENKKIEREGKVAALVAILLLEFLMDKAILEKVCEGGLYR